LARADRALDDRASPEDLLNVDIFYDFRPVHGDAALAAELWREAWDTAAGSAPFLRQLAEAGIGQEPPIGLFGRLKTEKGGIDLKRHGLWPIVRSARLLALRHGVACRSTAERLQAVVKLRVGGASDLAGALEAQEQFLELILRAQLGDRLAGRLLSSRVPVSLIETGGGLARLKANLRLASSLDELARDQLASSG
jgi:CBS domain-containing protein